MDCRHVGSDGEKPAAGFRRQCQSFRRKLDASEKRLREALNGLRDLTMVSSSRLDVLESDVQKRKAYDAVELTPAIESPAVVSEAPATRKSGRVHPKSQRRPSASRPISPRRAVRRWRPQPRPWRSPRLAAAVCIDHVVDQVRIDRQPLHDCGRHASARHSTGCRPRVETPSRRAGRHGFMAPTGRLRPCMEVMPTCGTDRTMPSASQNDADIRIQSSIALRDEYPSMTQLVVDADQVLSPWRTG